MGKIPHIQSEALVYLLVVQRSGSSILANHTWTWRNLLGFTVASDARRCLDVTADHKEFRIGGKAATPDKIKAT